MAAPDGSAGAPPESLQLLAEEVVLDLPAVEQLLSQAANAAAAGVGLSCGITYVARYGVITVASSDARANAVDEIQYGAGEGPCLEALRAGEMVRVDDLATEGRWGGYRDLALQAGVRSSVSFPLIVRGRPLGALNVYSTEVGPWPADQEAAAILASSQTTGLLHAVRGLAANLVRDPDAARGIQERHEFDVATGMLMAAHGYGAAQARTALVERAADRGISVALVAQLMATDQRDPRLQPPQTGRPEGGPAQW